MCQCSKRRALAPQRREASPPRHAIDQGVVLRLGMRLGAIRRDKVYWYLKRLGDLLVIGIWASYLRFTGTLAFRGLLVFEEDYKCKESFLTLLFMYNTYCKLDVYEI